MRGDVIAAIEAVPRYKVVLNKPGFGSLLQRIMAILRDLIQRQLELYRQSLRVVEKPKPKPVQTHPSCSKLTQLFPNQFEPLKPTQTRPNPRRLVENIFF